jgi:type I restriction enzyme S subunit
MITSDGGIIRDRQKWRYISADTSARFPKTVLSEGDLVMSVRGTIGKVAIVPRELDGANMTANLLRIAPKREKIDSRFLWRFMRSHEFGKLLKSKSSSTTIETIKAPDFKALPVPVPPLAEQKRLAGILDAADALRAKRREAIRQLDSLLQATFLDLFGDPVANPRGWETVPLSTRSKRVTKGASPNWQGFSYQNSGVLFVTSENVRDGYLDVSSPKYVSQAFHDKLKGSQLAPGDLLVNLVGASIGRSCLFKNDGCAANVNQAVGVVTLDDAVFATYIVNLLQTDQGKSMLTGRIVEAARANVSLASLRKIMIPVPPADLQRRFSAISTKVGQQKSRQLQHLAELDTLFASLQSRAFRGELDAG